MDERLLAACVAHDPQAAAHALFEHLELASLFFETRARRPGHLRARHVEAGLRLAPPSQLTLETWFPTRFASQGTVAGPWPFRSRLPRPVGHGRQFVPEPGTRKTSIP